jgi:hypothetical protein
MKALREIARIKSQEVQLNDKMKGLEKHKLERVWICLPAA